MSLKALSSYTVYSRYAHYLPDKKRRETWDEITDRVFAMHERRYAAQLAASEDLRADFAFAKEMVRQKRVLGSQRALQFGGKWIEDKPLRLFNCATTHVNRPRAFQEIMYTLLCGTGMGFSVQKQHVQMLPQISRPAKGTKTFQIPDTIEGWADAVGVLVASYLPPGDEFSSYAGHVVLFDYSLIRPEGALIAGQFKAPGFKGLAAALEKMRKVLERRIASEGFAKDGFSGKMRPIDAYDLIMHASDAVLSGGVRRSATISIFSIDDAEMTSAKTGNWFVENPQRARSNNSAALLKGQTTREQFHGLMEAARQYGEPGFIWLDNLDVVYNPCCLAGDTKVTMVDGVKALSEVRVGDLVMSHDTNVDMVVPRQVTFAGMTRRAAETMCIVTQMGAKLVCTPDHEIYARGYGWVPAGILCAGDRLRSETGGWDEIVSIGLHEAIDVYDITVEDTHCFYANGLLVHNCEIGMIPSLDGESGVQGCNLVEINGKYCSTEERFIECCRAAAIIGTMQAGYTNFSYLTAVSKRIFDKEALLGCSVTGIMDNPEVLLNKKTQQQGAKIILEHNARVAALIGINPTARATCVKPAGSTSCVLETASGIHPHHARRYLRRTQANRNEFALQVIQKVNPSAVEPSVWGASGEDQVISFACEVPKGARLKNDISAVEFLSQIKLTQNNWVEYGTRPELCTDPKMRHNVSVTVIVRPEEWGAIEDYVFKYQRDFAGISMLPASGDLDYPQAPFATVLTPEEIVREYGDGSILASGLVVDGLHAFEGNLWAACEQVLGVGGSALSVEAEPVEPVKPLRKAFKTDKTFAAALADYAIQLNLFYQAMYEWRQVTAKLDWVRRAKQFASRYYADDVRRATYCLKHVSLWHTWLTLKRTHVEIDWATVVEETETHVAADTLAAAACVGNQCTL